MTDLPDPETALAPRRRIRVLAVALVVGFGLLLDIAGAQVGKRMLVTWNPAESERRYRVAAPIYHHDLAPNVVLTAVWGGRTYPYRTNSLGFRDASNRAVALRASGPRLLLLGDSFTEGIGVPYEQTFAGIIAGRLNPCGVEVLNAAVSSYSPAIYYAKTRDLLERRRLEVTDVAVFIDMSDVTDEAKVYQLDSDGVVRDAPRSASPPASLRLRALRFIKNNSLTAHVGAALVAAVRPSAKGPGAFNQERVVWSIQPDSFESYGRRGLRLSEEHMDSLLSMTRRHHISLSIAVYPWPDQIVRQDLGSPQRVEWGAWAASRGVRFVDLFPAFIGATDPAATVDRLFIPGDIHWNLEGHREVARAVGDLGFCGIPATGSTRPESDTVSGN